MQTDLQSDLVTQQASDQQTIGQTSRSAVDHQPEDQLPTTSRPATSDQRRATSDERHATSTPATNDQKVRKVDGRCSGP